MRLLAKSVICWNIMLASLRWYMLPLLPGGAPGPGVGGGGIIMPWAVIEVAVRLKTLEKLASGLAGLISGSDASGAAELPARSRSRSRSRSRGTILAAAARA